MCCGVYGIRRCKVHDNKVIQGVRGEIEYILVIFLCWKWYNVTEGRQYKMYSSFLLIPVTWEFQAPFEETGEKR